jgi:hypothetical protein
VTGKGPIFGVSGAWLPRIKGVCIPALLLFRDESGDKLFFVFIHALRIIGRKR